MYKILSALIVVVTTMTIYEAFTGKDPTLRTFNLKKVVKVYRDLIPTPYLHLYSEGRQ
jgi:hypothetical protein